MDNAIQYGEDVEHFEREIQDPVCHRKVATYHMCMHAQSIEQPPIHSILQDDEGDGPDPYGTYEDCDD